MSLYEKLYGKQDERWHSIEVSFDCLECGEPVTEGMYDNDTGKVHITCNSGHNSEYWIGAGHAEV